MDKSIYFIILDIGMTYEKGAQSAGLWKIGEKKKLNAEIVFWMSLIRNVREENRGVDCSDIAFDHLRTIAGKYKLPNYKLILSKWTELQGCRFETDPATEQKVCSIMEELLDKALHENKKYKKYEFIRILHNIPHCMHGASCMQPGFKSVSLDNALEYAGLSESCGSRIQRNGSGDQEVPCD